MRKIFRNSSSDTQFFIQSFLPANTEYRHESRLTHTLIDDTNQVTMELLTTAASVSVKQVELQQQQSVIIAWQTLQKCDVGPAVRQYCHNAAPGSIWSSVWCEVCGSFLVIRTGPVSVSQPLLPGSHLAFTPCTHTSHETPCTQVTSVSAPGQWSVITGHWSVMMMRVMMISDLYTSDPRLDSSLNCVRPISISFIFSAEQCRDFTARREKTVLRSAEPGFQNSVDTDVDTVVDTDVDTDDDIQLETKNSAFTKQPDKRLLREQCGRTKPTKWGLSLCWFVCPNPTSRFYRTASQVVSLSWLNFSNLLCVTIIIIIFV